MSRLEEISERRSLSVYVVAPTGRDAELTLRVLHENGIAAERSSDLNFLVRESAGNPIGALLIAEEALDAATSTALIDYVGGQSPWSDLPVLILTGNSRSLSRNRGNRFDDLGSPVLLERPLRPDILISSVRAALRARKRQYEIRDTLRERDSALAALRNEQETLHVIIDNLPVGIIVVGGSGNVLLSNRMAEQILRRDLHVGDRIGTDGVWQSLLPTGRDQRCLDPGDYPLQRALKTSEVVPPEDFLQHHDDGSSGWIRIAAAPIIDQRGAVSGAVAAISDIDRNKRAEEALMKSEKLAAVGRLAASISHEINNPLEAVTNLLYLVEQSTRSTPASQLAAKAQEELARVSRIVTQTLRFHRQSSSPHWVALNELLDPAIGLFRGRISNANIQLDLQYRTVCRILCRDGDIRQVLSNLIGNAVDSMRSGGRLVVRTSGAHQAKTDVAGVRISIADTGHGIPKEAMRRIFEPFYTTKGESGTGLGLWISQEIVKRNQGSLQIRSRAATLLSGTVATVFLPV
ncbi:MAG TPA: ATP-binding protein, partial [Terracidiphilus sp.]|nr:ATP-binding protein [Terracidiphilus sp.]